MQGYPAHGRFRCLGNIINFAVQSFLFCMVNEDLELPEGVDELPSNEELDRWQRKSPVGKLHNTSKTPAVVRETRTPLLNVRTLSLASHTYPPRGTSTFYGYHALKIDISEYSKLGKTLHSSVRRGMMNQR